MDSSIAWFFVTIIVLFIYFFPTLIAYERLHNNRVAILICNLFLGWTFIGWVISLIWAYTKDIEIKNFE